MIYTLTLNPAIDREYVVPSLDLDTVMRASYERVDFGGKGFNVSRLLKSLGVTSTALGFVGGKAGEQLEDGLHSLGIETDFVWLPGETRTNVSIISQQDGHHFKVNAQGPYVKEEFQDQLLRKIDTLAQPGDWWVLAGSLPPGVDEDYYARVIRLLNAQQSRVILDTTGKALAMGCAEKPYLVKPNIEEARQLTGMPMQSTREIALAANEICHLGARNVFISMGKLGALWNNAEETLIIKSPKVDEKNPIGAGDSTVGGLVWALSQGFSIHDAICWAAASGAATASLSGTEVGTKELIEKLVPQVCVEPFIQE